ncbi:hypothetical protein [[Limnothrix rosea] IAM M-220]|uniref:hypothetical protein n=1 Tax=[Limnothrix rosea] IAM M-220 TaxID=454133 RepID=UPI000967D61E|nr:hypothetical protein [[Limnothrix rosea] IAM M-220]OKH17740.1 hypothetical protein NIES208_07905 [[Limnothrix rosea] IAM M-220]
MFDKQRRKILIVTKTYPSISTKYKETVCTAGMLLDDEEKPLGWIRIYPIRFRKLDFDKRYPRWSIISAEIWRDERDSRKESHKIEDQSIQLIRKIDTQDAWQERKSFILPFLDQSIKQIQSENRSLGLLKPKQIKKFYIKETTRAWSERQQGVLDQYDLLEKPVDLEKIPYQFGYEFIDEDDFSHKFSINDWEIAQLYRQCRDRSRKIGLEAEQEALVKVKAKLEGDFLKNKDLYFFVGNQKRFKNFMTIGLIYPPKVKTKQLSFDL